VVNGNRLNGFPIQTVIRSPGRSHGANEKGFGFFIELDETAMMTPAQYDRLERLARLLCEAAGRDLRKSRQQTKKLKRWVVAQQECDAAEQAMKERPQDSDKKNYYSGQEKSSIKRARISNIKAKMHDVAIVHDVVFAF
jgi:hypothetical protein